ncbi:MAG: glutamyl-tRNA reductase [Planctomycetota bacterium]
MKLLMLGINHRTADVALRERLAVAPDRLDATLRALHEMFPAADLAFISTCNRTELYAARPTHERPTPDDLEHTLAALPTLGSPSATQDSLDPQALRAALIHREQRDAVLHLTRLCTGLDSMIVGEPQVQGQVRRAYEAAATAGAIDGPLHAVFQAALAAGKRARTETGIDTGKRSVGGAAVDLIERVFEHVAGKTVVCLGAGEMAKAALQRITQLGPKHTWVVNRTPQRAAELAASLNLSASTGGPRPLDDLDALLVEADIVLTSTASAEPILTAERLNPVVRKRRARPLVAMDMALPRDIDPAVGRLRNVYLYNVDDLRTLVDTSDTKRDAAVRHAEALANQAADRCYHRLQHSDVGRTVRDLRHLLTDLADAESDRTARRLAAKGLDDDQFADALAEHNHRLINKLLHVPLNQLKQSDDNAPLAFYAAALRRLFGLHGDGQADAADAEPQAEPLDEPPVTPTRAEPTTKPVVVTSAASGSTHAPGRSA